jgi:putative PIN family toxin of toxin-antitoxin system
VRIVLDTNVCLDAFVFADPRAATIVAALASAAVEAVTRADCRDEWLAVLQYPALKLDETSIAEAVARFDAAVTMLPVEAPAIPLPRCRDPDDQKFLELAAASGAAVLFSRDAEVLKLGRRTSRNGLFSIMKPEDWAAPARPLLF